MADDAASIGFRIEGDRDHPRLCGDLVFATASGALAALNTRLVGSDGSLVANLDGLRRSDSAGLAVLVEWLAQAHAKGIPMRLVNAPPGLRALARLADLEAELFD